MQSFREAHYTNALPSECQILGRVRVPQWSLQLFWRVTMAASVSMIKQKRDDANPKCRYQRYNVRLVDGLDTSQTVRESRHVAVFQTLFNKIGRLVFVGLERFQVATGFFCAGVES